jgi:hypothetical protein
LDGEGGLDADSGWSADLDDLAQAGHALGADSGKAAYDPGAHDPGAYGPRDWSPPETEEHFEPPDPPPALGGDPLIVLGWIGLIGGLAIVFAWAIVGPLVPVWLARAGLIGIVAGAAALNWKMPHRRDPEDRDDGAQV